MPVKRVPPMGWTKRSAAATIRLMSIDQREAMAQRVAALMDAQGLTNEALAFKAGVATKTISRVLNARHESRAGTIEKLAKALGVKEWELRGSPVYAPRSSDAETPDPFGGPTVADIDRRLSHIETQLDELLGRKPAVAAIDEHTAEEAVDYLKRATQVMQDTLGRLGRDVGRQDLTASPAADRAQKRSPAAA